MCWGRPLLPPPAMGAVPVPNLLGKPALSPSARLILSRSTGGGLVKCVCLMLFGFLEPWISDFRHHLLLTGRQEDRPCVPQIVQSNRPMASSDCMIVCVPLPTTCQTDGLPLSLLCCHLPAIFKLNYATTTTSNGSSNFNMPIFKCSRWPSHFTIMVHGRFSKFRVPIILSSNEQGFPILLHFGSPSPL